MPLTSNAADEAQMIAARVSPRIEVAQAGNEQ
jgi:hypothetical protein